MCTDTDQWRSAGIKNELFRVLMATKYASNMKMHIVAGLLSGTITDNHTEQGLASESASEVGSGEP